MSYQTEHQRMQPILDLARQLDIASNPDLNALFEAGSGGFQVWCTPWDHPSDWHGIAMNTGAFSKPCEYVGSVHWKWDEEEIVALSIETTAYALAEQKPDEFCDLAEIPEDFHRSTILNREADIAWLKEKVARLFAEAGVPLPPFDYEPAQLPDGGSHLLAHYVSDLGEYVVILSPDLDPQEFCRPGYELTCTLEIGNAGDFPVDVILRPEQAFYERDTEPDEGSLVEQYENASRLHDDDWLEAGFEDRISGWDE
ncbi:MAG: hypothetical protein HY867_08965 [Chloroflexi bacterium]|nr:hypothetical protein [Chloroflexota bacterium]